MAPPDAYCYRPGQILPVACGGLPTPRSGAAAILRGISGVSSATLDAELGCREKSVTGKAVWFDLSRLLNGILLGVCAIKLTGCGTIHSARMWFPRASEMDEVDPQPYVEPLMSAKQRQEVQRQINNCRAAVENICRNITTSPYFGLSYGRARRSFRLLRRASMAMLTLAQQTQR
jgi:hypothetical protein